MKQKEFKELTNEERRNLLRSYEKDVDRLHKAISGIVDLVDIGFGSFDLARNQMLNAIQTYRDSLEIYEGLCENKK